MADTSVPARMEDVQPIAVEDHLRTSLARHSLTWLEDRLIPTSSSIPDRSTLASLREAYDLACEPADRKTLKSWLTLLWAGTKKQSSMGDLVTDQVLTVYAVALGKYPADLVHKVLSTWTSTPKPKDAHHWWPALGEIEDAIRGPADTRRMIRDGLKEWDMDKGKHVRLSQLYRELAVLEGGDFTFHIRELMHASREEQRAGIAKEAARVRAEIYQLEGPNTFARAAGDN